MATGSSDAYVRLENVSTTQGPFSLISGSYGLTVSANWGGGSVELDIIGADGTTKIPVIAAFTANDFATGHLPDGTYYVTIATATSVYFTLSKIRR